MQSVIKILLSVCIAGFFGVIFLLTFFSSNSSVSVPQFSTFQSGSQLYGIWDVQNWHKNSLSLFESVYSNVQVESYTFSGSSLELDIKKPWLYMSSFYDIVRDYVFIWDGYKITQEGIGEVFIDSESYPWKILVYSTNTSITVELQNTESWDIYTDMYLYPHMYAEITPSRWKLLNGADMIRVDTIFNMWFTAWSEWEDTVISRYIWDEGSFYNYTIKLIRNSHMSAQNILEIFRSQEDFLSLWSLKIDEYSMLFVNRHKKKLILKNIILQDIIQLLKLTWSDTSLIWDIRKNMSKLQAYDSTEYKQMQGIIENLIYLNNTDINLETSISKIMLSLLKYPDIVEEKELFLLYGFSIFSNLEFSGVLNYTFFRNFLESFNGFIFEESDIVSENTKKRYQYFSFYLEKNLLFLMNRETRQNIDISLISDILDKHVWLWVRSYDSDVISRVTGLYVYNTLLENIQVFVKNRYFEESRDQYGLLQIGEKASYSSSEMSSFGVNIEKVFTIYERNKKFLNSENGRDIAIWKDFEISQAWLREYFAALESYDLYASEYDLLKNEIKNLGTFNSAYEQSLLSKNEITLYLSQFSWLNLLNTSVTIIDDTHYSLVDVNVLGQKLSFDIYPNDSYKMTNIFLDGIAQNTQYKLDNIILDDRSWVWNSFFLTTFGWWTGNQKQVEIFEEKSIRTSEDPAEIIFKRDKLLGLNWEFESILDIIPIKYNNIRLDRQVDGYDIYIENVPLFIAGKKYVFEAQYLLNDTEHHFINIRFTDEVLSFKETLPMQTIISWKVFVSDMPKLVKQLTTLTYTALKINSKISDLRRDIDTMVINYSYSSKKTLIKFDSWWENYTISISTDGENIDSIFRWITRLTNGTIPPDDIEKYFQ